MMGIAGLAGLIPLARSNDAGHGGAERQPEYDVSRRQDPAHCQCLQYSGEPVGAITQVTRSLVLTSRYRGILQFLIM